jgi:hypothetical protein
MALECLQPIQQVVITRGKNENRKNEGQSIFSSCVLRTHEFQMGITTTAPPLWALREEESCPVMVLGNNFIS